MEGQENPGKERSQNIMLTEPNEATGCIKDGGNGKGGSRTGVHGKVTPEGH